MIFNEGEMVRQNPDEVRLRYGLHKAFGINCLSSARSNISDKLLVKFYSQFSGLHKSQFEKKRTERTRISFNKVIFPHISFKTKQMQDLLADMMQVYIYHTSKTDFTREFEFYGTKYSIGCGGIHTQDPPRVLKSNDKYSLLELKPITGRTHQLRVHLKYLGHPILGDRVYGDEEASRLFLHAGSLEITIPGGERKIFEAPLPEEFGDVL